MPIVYDLMDPAVLTEVVRETPEPAMIGLNAVLPDRVVPSIEAAWDDITQTNRSAVFRSWDAETPVGQRDSASRKTAEMLPVGRKYLLGEYDLLKAQQMRTGGDVSPLLRDSILNDAQRGANEVRVRAEYARGDVLTDGKLTIDENGVTVEYDFDVPSANIDTASASWHSTSTDIPAEIGAFLDAASDELDEGGYMLVSRKTARSLAQNADYQSLASVGGVTPPRLSLGDVNAVHERLGFPEVRVYNSSFSGGRVLGEDIVVFVPRDPSELGYTAWGLTAEGMELAEANAMPFEDAPGLVAVVITEGEPVKRWTKVTGVPLPILTNPRRLGVYDVTP